MIDDGLSRPCSTGCGIGPRGVRRAACGGLLGAAARDRGLRRRRQRLRRHGGRPASPARPCAVASCGCGPGMAVCVGGRFVCNAPQPRPEVCDGADNDCDGMVDNGIPSAGTCGLAQGVCRAGTFECRGGRFVCRADESMRGTETCDGLDNNCNGLVDEGNPGGGGELHDRRGRGAALRRGDAALPRRDACACEGGTAGHAGALQLHGRRLRRDGRRGPRRAPAGSARAAGAASACQCRTPCLPGEFPCSVGLACNSENFCVPPLCGTEICTPPQVCVRPTAASTSAPPSTARVGPRVQRPRRRAPAAWRTTATAWAARAPSSAARAPASTTAAPPGPARRGSSAGPTRPGGAQCVRSCATTSARPRSRAATGRCVADPCQGFSLRRRNHPASVVGGRGVCQPDPAGTSGRSRAASAQRRARRRPLRGRHLRRRLQRGVPQRPVRRPARSRP
jgi:hypothetical protein